MLDIKQLLPLITSPDEGDYTLAIGIIGGMIDKCEVYEWEIVYLCEFTFICTEIEYSLLPRLCHMNLTFFQWRYINNHLHSYEYSQDIIRRRIELEMNLESAINLEIKEWFPNNEWNSKIIKAITKDNTEYINILR